VTRKGFGVFVRFVRAIGYMCKYDVDESSRMDFNGLTVSTVTLSAD
jgi:hypothetical protein